MVLGGSLLPPEPLRAGAGPEWGRCGGTTDTKSQPETRIPWDLDISRGACHEGPGILRRSYFLVVFGATGSPGRLCDRGERSLPCTLPDERKVLWQSCLTPACHRDQRFRLHLTCFPRCPSD